MWEIIGFETQENDAGEVTAYTVHAVKAYREGQGQGKRGKRIWYRASEQGYRPVVGEKVVIEVEVRGKYEVVTDIYPA